MDFRNFTAEESSSSGATINPLQNDGNNISSSPYSPSSSFNHIIFGLNITQIPEDTILLYVPIAIAILGIFGNLLTFLTIILSDLRKNYVNKYLMVLLLSDTELLLKIIAERAFHPNQLNYWACFFSQYLWNAPIYISNLTILLLTTERFFAIMFPFGHLKYTHIGRWHVIIAMLCFVFVANFNLKFVLANNEAKEFEKSAEKCVYRYNAHFPLAKPLFLLPRIFVTFILPLLAVIIVNILIAIKLRGHSIIQSTSTSNDQRANNKILFIIPIFYVLFNLPYNLYLAIAQFIDPTFRSRHLNLITLDIFFINHSINFILYALASKIFRQSFLCLWIRPFCPPEVPTSQNQQENSSNSKGTQETNL